jgi:hypothetical protein
VIVLLFIATLNISHSEQFISTKFVKTGKEMCSNSKAEGDVDCFDSLAYYRASLGLSVFTLE